MTAERAQPDAGYTPELVRHGDAHVWVVSVDGKPEYYTTYDRASARAEQLAERDTASLVYRACPCVGVEEGQR